MARMSVDLEVPRPWVGLITCTIRILRTSHSRTTESVPSASTCEGDGPGSSCTVAHSEPLRAPEGDCDRYGQRRRSWLRPPETSTCRANGRGQGSTHGSQHVGVDPPLPHERVSHRRRPPSDVRLGTALALPLCLLALFTKLVTRAQYVGPSQALHVTGPVSACQNGRTESARGHEPSRALRPPDRRTRVCLRCRARDGPVRVCWLPRFAPPPLALVGPSMVGPSAARGCLHTCGPSSGWKQCTPCECPAKDLERGVKRGRDQSARLQVGHPPHRAHPVGVQPEEGGGRLRAEGWAREGRRRVTLSGKFGQPGGVVGEDASTLVAHRQPGRPARALPVCHGQWDRAERSAPPELVFGRVVGVDVVQQNGAVGGANQQRGPVQAVAMHERCRERPVPAAPAVCHAQSLGADSADRVERPRIPPRQRAVARRREQVLRASHPRDAAERHGVAERQHRWRADRGGLQD
eukprot:scaffold392_cov101-Isochrysis_galbana.AAC.13